MRAGGQPLAGAPVKLLVKPWGAESYSVLKNLTTDSEGRSHTTVGPLRNTSYRWHFPGDGENLAASSPAKSVGVRARVTIALADATLRPGQTLVVTGKVTPAKPGFVATLWRKTVTGKVKLASTTMVRADGTYRIAKALQTKGTYVLFVTVPAAKGNLAGTSPTRTATVG